MTKGEVAYRIRKMSMKCADPRDTEALSYALAVLERVDTYLIGDVILAHRKETIALQAQAIVKELTKEAL